LAVSLNSKRFGNAEHKRTVWDADAAKGDTLADLMRPDYWSHVARNLRPKDRIEVVCEDNSYFAELYVIDAGTNWANVSLLRYEVFAENEANHGVAKDPEYKISHGGNYHKWRVTRLSDGEVLKSQLPTEKAAQDWLFEHRKSLAR
jgi:hypothetical protein